MPDLAFDYDRYRVSPGEAVSLAKHTTNDDQGLDENAAKDALKENRDRLADLQERLFAESKQALLVVLQAMDTGGKDSTIRHVFEGVNPQGCRVWGFKAPTEWERAHDFLWRIHHRTPAKGMIGVFNRSHYEDVLVVRVKGMAPLDVIERRYDHINHFERLLHEEGTRIVKIMLHISKDYQLDRLRRRLEKPDKYWKFNPDDLKERARWGDYMDAFEIALARCSTVHAPWYVVPAETRWFRDLVVSEILVDTLEAMNPQFPEPDYNPDDYPPESLQ